MDIWKERRPPGRDDPNFNRIVVEILFSRRFILGYHVCVAAVTLGVSLSYWSRRLIQWRRRKLHTPSKSHEATNVESQVGHQSSSNVESSIDQHSSASSSTLASLDELSPLLSKENLEENRRGTFLNSLRGWMMYQPRPVFGKVLPSNDSSLLVAVLLGLNIFYSVYRVPFSIPLLFVFADRVSLVFVANLPWLYLLAAKNQPLQKIAGLSYEGLNIYHRRLGELMCLLALLHGLGMFGVWYTLLRPLSYTLARFIFSKVILLGIGTLIAYELLYFTSLGSFRQWWYEIFLASHIFLQIAALALLWFHHKSSRIYIYISLAIYTIDRVVFRMFIRTSHTQAKLQVLSDGETVRVSAETPLCKPSFLTAFFSNPTTGWKATDHMFLSTPSLSWKDALTAHPFTIAASAPTDSAITTPISFIIRSQSGFSLDLLHAAQKHQSVSLRLDGPYGSHHALDLVHSTDESILVAGGSGIAVTWPLVWSLLSTPDLDPESSARIKKRILFIWIIHSASHTSWLDNESLSKLRSRGIEVLFPPPTSTHGRPDLKSLIRDSVSREKSTRTSLDNAGSKTKSIGVVCSGPDGLNRVARNTCAELVAEGRDVDVVVEKFGW
jgi:hypothetical protein